MLSPAQLVDPVLDPDGGADGGLVPERPGSLVIEEKMAPFSTTSRK